MFNKIKIKQEKEIKEKNIYQTDGSYDRNTNTGGCGIIVIKILDGKITK